MATKEITGCVFNIQQFSIHDGPGIRTIVFLKGCPLRCQWCCNPESQSPQPELAFDDKKCIGVNQCNLCIPACPQHAIEATESGKVVIDRTLCTNCMKCADVCPSRALETIGKRMSVLDVLTAVEKDSCFFFRSGGGLTLSGGEPLAQSDFAIALLKAAKSIGMDTAVETSGYVEWGVLEEASRHINTIIYDIKCVDPKKHKQFTGFANNRILDNFSRLCLAFPHIPKIVRTPVIPKVNDEPGEIESIARFIKSFPNVKHELLPYHAFGEPKYVFMGKHYKLSGVRPPSSERMTLLRDRTG